MHASFNKHRFRNFCIGFSFACSLTLFAFTYKVDYHPEEIFGQIPEPPPGGVTVVSHQFKPPTPEKPQVNTTPKKAVEYQQNAKLKIVTNITPISTRADVLSPVLTAPPALPQLSMAKTNAVEIFVDEKPSFPGGQQALLAFFDQHIEYPYDVEESGRVLLEFVVDEEGKISSIKVLSNDMPLSAVAEVKRVMKIMPKWIPGKKAGKPVKARFIQPFLFRLN